MDIPERILTELKLLPKIVGTESNWIVLKKQLLISLPHELRTHFSTRDPKTKKQSVNQFEKSVIEFYENMTGLRLELPNEK